MAIAPVITGAQMRARSNPALGALALACIAQNIHPAMLDWMAGQYQAAAREMRASGLPKTEGRA